VLPTYKAQGGDRKQIQNAALAAVKTDISNDFKQEFDLVLFCMPPGTTATMNKATGISSGSWLAYAVNLGSAAYFNDRWCSSVSAQMHEVGHNFGLDHSGEQSQASSGVFQKYGDQSGLMGFSYDKDDTKICFNPAKNWQLNWYENQEEIFNPLTDSGMEADNYMKRIKLNGVSDYGQNPNAVVVLQLGHGTDTVTQDTDSYFVGFNRADGINAETVEDPDFVTIVMKKGDPRSPGISTKIAGIAVGKSFIIENFGNKTPQRDVEIKFLGLSNDDTNFGRDATIEIIDLLNYQPPAVLSPPACRTYIITTATDFYPNDSDWYIVEKGGVGTQVASSPTFPLGETTYTEELCLPYDMCYQYTIIDQYGDGICCGQGKGGFKIEDDSEPRVQVLGGGDFFDNTVEGDVDFLTKKDISFCVGPNPNPPSPPPPDETNNQGSNQGNNQEEDDLDYLFENKDGKDCKVWVVKYPEKCEKKDVENGNKRVSEFCPITCSNNNETDNNGSSQECSDKEDKFKHKGKKIDCEKVIDKKWCNKKYKGKDSFFKKKDKLWKACPKSCGKCDKI